MSITRKNYSMFAFATVGAMLLAACSPSPQSANNANPSSATAETAAPSAKKSVEALSGLKIVEFGPSPVKAGEAFNAQPDGSSAVWAKADRNLGGYEAALWLDGKRLDGRGIAGDTVSGLIPAASLARAATLPLEIRIGDDGSELSSTKVDFVIE